MKLKTRDGNSVSEVNEWLNKGAQYLLKGSFDEDAMRAVHACLKKAYPGRSDSVIWHQATYLGLGILGLDAAFLFFKQAYYHDSGSNPCAKDTEIWKHMAESLIGQAHFEIVKTKHIFTCMKRGRPEESNNINHWAVIAVKLMREEKDILDEKALECLRRLFPKVLDKKVLWLQGMRFCLKNLKSIEMAYLFFKKYKGYSSDVAYERVWQEMSAILMEV